MIDINQLEQKLNELPGKIRKQKDIVIERDRDVQSAKLEYDIHYGMALIGAKRPNATEKKADAVIAAQSYAEKLIEAQYQLKKEESGLKYLEDKFTALRKIGSLEIEMIKSQLTGT